MNTTWIVEPGKERRTRAVVSTLPCGVQTDWEKCGHCLDPFNRFVWVCVGGLSKQTCLWELLLIFFVGLPITQTWGVRLQPCTVIVTQSLCRMGSGLQKLFPPPTPPPPFFFFIRRNYSQNAVTRVNEKVGASYTWLKLTTEWFL